MLLGLQGVFVDIGVVRFESNGIGKVLTGLMRRINKEITGVNVETPEQLETLCQKLAA